jgi:hypothetical protein
VLRRTAFGLLSMSAGSPALRQCAVHATLDQSHSDFTMPAHRIQVASDQEHNEVVIEIYAGEQFVCQISQDAGYENAVLEFGHGGETTKMSLKDFEAALADAKDRLARMQKPA